MIRKIGMDAGIIWNYLDSTCGCSTKKLKEQLKMNDKEFFLALGWLAREENIVFYEKEGVEFIYIDY
jgi:hypothetical protein